MRRAWMMVFAACGMELLLPFSALAEDSLPASVFYPHIGVSIIGLVVAVVLLIEAIGVRRIGQGGAIAEKISYVILAILCLAASAITEWFVIFTDQAVSVAQAQLAREVLVIVAMGLLAAYFNSVRVAMRAYLHSMTGSPPPSVAAGLTPDAAGATGATDADSDGETGRA